MMEIKKCKNKNCQRSLPEGYKYKYCENCRNEHIKQFKNGLKTTLGCVAFVGSTAIAIATKGKINPKK